MITSLYCTKGTRGWGELSPSRCRDFGLQCTERLHNATYNLCLFFFNLDQSSGGWVTACITSNSTSSPSCDKTFKINESNKDKNISDCCGNHLIMTVKSFSTSFPFISLICCSANKLGRWWDVWCVQWANIFVSGFFCQGIVHVVCHISVNLNPYIQFSDCMWY